MGPTGRIERGNTIKGGGTSKMCSWTRVRRNGAFGARAHGLPYSTVETRHFETYPNRFGYILDRYQYRWIRACIVFGSGSRQDPLRGTPIYPPFKILTDMNKYFGIIFGALAGNPRKSPWGSYRDKRGSCRKGGALTKIPAELLLSGSCRNFL